MSGGRPPGPRAYLRVNHEELTMVRLQGESDGRTLGRISERKLIVEWLKFQSGTPAELSVRIRDGEHTRNP